MASQAPQADAAGPWQSFWLPWAAVLAVALACRLLWLDLFQGEVGGDAIRYLWISEHVRQGNWLLLPQLFSSPLLPLAVGLLSHLSGEALTAARIIGITGNTLAVALAMLWLRALVPERPALAWLSGLGLAVNHVWCRLAPFALTENLFYPLLMGLFCLALKIREQPRWNWGAAFGLVWGLLFLSREIGLFSGAAVFALVVLSLWRRQPTCGAAWQAVRRLAAAVLPVTVILVGVWVFWFHQAFGIISLGEGHRFYAQYASQFDRASEASYPGYRAGEFDFFRLRPYELMEYTRFPHPGDDRYPTASAMQLLAQPGALAALVWDNLVWSLKGFQKVTLPGFIVLVIVLPLGGLSGRVHLPGSALFLFGASGAILGLHFLGPVREARLIGWFFPWLYLGLAVFFLWLWDLVAQSGRSSAFKRTVSALLIGLLGFHLCYPQYFKEVPRRWAIRKEPHIQTLAAAFILSTSGPGAVISSREAEVAYRAQAYWIGQPQGSPADLVEWLYLGGADYLLFHDKYPLLPEQQILWEEPDQVRQAIPELELVAEVSALANHSYGQRARLFRFHPDPAKFQAYQKRYPWAGTHPRETMQDEGPPWVKN